MKKEYVIAAGAAVVGAAAFFFFRRKKTHTPALPQKENERHHLTNAFARAKQLATGR